MKTSTALALAVAILVAGLSAAAATEAPAVHPVYHHHRVHHRIPVARNALAPPAVQNDSDGLSVDPENCNMGCLGNTE